MQLIAFYFFFGREQENKGHTVGHMQAVVASFLGRGKDTSFLPFVFIPLINVKGCLEV
jgi:hypothetical protein